jgi:hypothetical protein
MLTVVFAMATVLSGSLLAQKAVRIIEPVQSAESKGVEVSKLAPTPIVISGNPNCAALNTSTDPAFAHISGNWERKFDPPSGGGPFPFTSGLSGGIPTNANLFMTYSMGPATQMNSFQLSWTTPSALNMLVSAVIIKGGPNGANVYTYPTLTAGDNAGPFTVPGGAQAVSHISFCFEPFSAPSAAPGTVAGRVNTSTGAPISGAIVLVQNLNTGEAKYATTNSFGRFSFSGLAVGDFFVLSVSHRRYVFNDATRSFTLESDLTDIDFTSTY